MVMAVLRVLEGALYGAAGGLSRVLVGADPEGDDEPLTTAVAAGEARATTRAWPRLTPPPGRPTAA
ncbi:MAG: hypothetical protein QOG03_1131 [Actinomycetota bacterium]|jgi:hypothetical protein|nr:hypothetical protein [Actinomycetota bacterium]